jgi:hypothetical protein
MMHAVVFGLLMSLSACTPADSNNFSASGQYNVNSSLGEDVGGDVDDTTDTGSDTGSSISKDAPTILSSAATIETSTDSILLTVGFSDPQDDLQGGSVYCKVSIDKGGMSDCLGSDGNLIPIDDKSARIDTNEDGGSVVEARLSLTLDGNLYEFNLGLIDAEGNQSETVTVTAK